MMYSVDEFRRRPTVAASFPLRFPNGAKWTEFRGRCCKCDVVFGVEDMRGDVVPVADDSYRTHDVQAFYIDALGYCEECELFTPFQYLLPDTMILVGVDTENRQLLIYDNRRRPWWKRARDWISML